MPHDTWQFCLLVSDNFNTLPAVLTYTIILATSVLWGMKMTGTHLLVGIRILIPLRCLLLLLTFWYVIIIGNQLVVVGCLRCSWSQVSHLYYQHMNPHPQHHYGLLMVLDHYRKAKQSIGVYEYTSIRHSARMYNCEAFSISNSYSMQAHVYNNDGMNVCLFENNVFHMF